LQQVRAAPVPRICTAPTCAASSCALTAGRARSCTPAPDEEEVPLFELVGDQGRKNGARQRRRAAHEIPPAISARPTPPTGALPRISWLSAVPHGDLAPCAGEKRLKSLLSKTRQWRSPAERAVAAAACDASGYENLARVLRNDVTSAALRKRDMVALARLWGYRSHIWRCVWDIGSLGLSAPRPTAAAAPLGCCV